MCASASTGYYGVLPYTLASTLACVPFLDVMAILCTLVVYYLAGLNSDSDRVVYFMINLWSALLVVRAPRCLLLSCRAWKPLQAHCVASALRGVCISNVHVRVSATPSLARLAALKQPQCRMVCTQTRSA